MFYQFYTGGIGVRTAFPHLYTLATLPDDLDYIL